MRPMSPLAPFRKWTVRAGIVSRSVVTLPLVGLRGVAHADLGDEPSSKVLVRRPGQVKTTATSPRIRRCSTRSRPTPPSQKQQAPLGPPFYEKWQFWALAGVVAVAAVGLVWGGMALSNNLGRRRRQAVQHPVHRLFGEGH